LDYVAGVDTHKEMHVIVFLDVVGKAVRTMSLPVTPKGFARAIASASELGGTVTWGLESTGCYGTCQRVWYRQGRSLSGDQYRLSMRRLVDPDA
jgi:transposase